ncbi:uncharacterized protein LOC131038938 [Cryptomeria japonica]|uniref:uncharacterized protein LOC131038938 n=1 Tax=Cryptomeria japonica TaxID=3369 RepID=UPI0027DA16AB|nr:uncharacterized protein LOC131038938 [Cryptomeria japonica]
MDKDGKIFGEEVSDRLGELHKKQQLNIDIALQTNLARQIASPQGPKHTEEEEKDEAEEQSDVYIMTADIVPHEGSSEVVVDVAVPLQAEGQSSPKYQVSQVKLGVDPTLSSEMVKWEPPSKQWIKINFDGASKGNPGTSGVGVVARDDNGFIIFKGAQHLQDGTNNEAKVQAAFLATKIALNMKVQRLHLEGDS